MTPPPPPPPPVVNSSNNMIQPISYNNQLMIVEQYFTNIATMQNMGVL